MELILASKSPRRSELLQDAGYKFKIICSDIDEETDKLKHLSSKDLVQVLSAKKAESVYKDHNNAVVLGSDTVVELDGEILGKPKDCEDAKQMLLKMQDKWHSVFSGVTIIGPKKRVTFVVESKVKFKKLNMAQINEYVQRVDVLDKAGSYGIQDGTVVETYNGSYSNIVGLPMDEVKTELEKFGVINGGN